MVKYYYEIMEERDEIDDVNLGPREHILVYADTKTKARNLHATKKRLMTAAKWKAQVVEMKHEEKESCVAELIEEKIE